MDPIVLVIIIVIAMPLAVVGALAISARLRGPMTRPESHRRVGSLVTEVIPETNPDEDDDREPGPQFAIDSEPPEPDPELRGPQAGL